MFDFGLSCLLNYIFFNLIKCGFDCLQFKPINIGYHLSTLHCLIILPVHLYLMTPLIDNRSQLAITLYNWLYAVTFSYTLLDFQLLIHYRDQKKYWMSMIVHHMMLLIIVLGGVYMNNIREIDPDFHWYTSLGYLTELSTPLLNYIQVNDRKVSRYVYIAFASIYFFCRPVNLAFLYYIAYQYHQNYQFHYIFLLTGNIVTILNYYWFYKIVRMAIRHSKKPQLYISQPVPVTDHPLKID